MIFFLIAKLQYATGGMARAIAFRYRFSAYRQSVWVAVVGVITTGVRKIISLLFFCRALQGVDMVICVVLFRGLKSEKNNQNPFPSTP
jgi:hypothetical protein